MTHDELKVLIEDKFNNQSPLHDAQIVNALYRVVELHKPVDNEIEGIYESTSFKQDICAQCATILYPCPTIQTIQKEII